MQPQEIHFKTTTSQKMESIIWKQQAVSRQTDLMSFRNLLKRGLFRLCKPCQENQSGESEAHSLLRPSFKRTSSEGLLLALLYTPSCSSYAIYHISLHIHCNELYILLKSIMFDLNPREGKSQAPLLFQDTIVNISCLHKAKYKYFLSIVLWEIGLVLVFEILARLCMLVFSRPNLCYLNALTLRS